MYVAAVNGCSWDPSKSSTNRLWSRGLSHWHMSKPLMYKPLSLCFNAFKWSCESSRTGPISEPAVKAQSHLLPWWTERVHRKWNWKSIWHTHMYCRHSLTHTHARVLDFYFHEHCYTHSHTRKVVHILHQSVRITDVWWASASGKLFEAKKYRFTRVIEPQSNKYESERALDCTKCKGILTLKLIKILFSPSHSMCTLNHTVSLT